MKTLNFKKWLAQQGVDTDYFWEQCKRKNQDWLLEESFYKRKKLETIDKEQWIYYAFKWSKTKQGWEYWDNLYTKWQQTLLEYLINDKLDKVKFGF